MSSAITDYALCVCVCVCVCVRARASQSLYYVSLTFLQCVLGSLAAKNPSALVATLQFKTGVPSDLEIRSPDLPLLPSRPCSCSSHGTPSRTPHCCHTSSILTHLALDKHMFTSDLYLSHPVCLSFSSTMDRHNVATPTVCSDSQPTPSAE